MHGVTQGSGLGQVLGHHVRMFVPEQSQWSTPNV